MSITSIINRNNYTGNDSTAVYPYTFKVFTKNDFEVKVRNTSTGVETLLVVDVNYTVSGAGTVAGGNITLIGAGAWLVASKLTTGYELSIRRLREIKQLADIKNQGSFYPETHEDVFDKLTMVDLQQQDSIDRTVKLPSSINPNSFNTDIPASIVGSVSRAFVTNPAGDGFDVGPTANEISNAQSYAIAADASADAAALSEAAADASADAAALSETNAAAAAVVAAAAEIATHAALTNTHGVSGDIVGTSDAQVITNKDIDGGTASNTSRITIPKNTKTNLDGLTRKQGTIVYDTTTNKPYYDDGTNLKVIGSGSGGSVNLITDGDAEGANPFTAYKDAGAASPVDGTSGSPAFVSIATSSTDPLTGDKSFLITKSFGNPIGEGVSVPFTVQPAYKARMLKISFDYFASTGFQPPATFNSDITVWIYDVTAGKLIQPSNIQIMSRDVNSTFQADFQSDFASTDYRLILHTGTVNTAAWTFKFDNVSVSPSQYVYAAPITDWIDYTPTIGATSGTLTNYTLSDTKWSRVGSNLYIKGKLTFTGSPGTWTFPTVSYPAGLTAVSAADRFPSVVRFLDFGTNVFGGDANPQSTAIQIASQRGTNGAQIAMGNTVPFTFTTNDFIEWSAGPIQIAGWSGNTQQSDDYTARDLKVNVLRSTNLTGLNPNNTSIKIPIAPTTIEDTYSGWDATNNRVLIKSAKSYDISYGAWIESTNVVSGQYYIVQLVKNGIEIDSSQMQYTSIASQFMRLPGSKKAISAVAGDYFEVWIYSSANHSSSTLTARQVWLDVQAVQAPTTMSRGVTVGANYSTTATTSYTSGSLAVFAPNTKISDYGAGGTYNTATGEFTANTSMQLQVDYHIQFSSASWTANTRLSMVLYKNGSTSGQENTSPYAQSTQSFVMADKGTFTIDVVAGDVIKIMVDQNSTSSKSLAGFAATNRITFKRAGG